MTTPTFPNHAPLAVQTRGNLVESVHFGSLAAVGHDGVSLLSRGEPAARVYPRSALKPLMAVAMLRAGLELPDDQLALAAASHSGGAQHQETAAKILANAGLSPENLGNSTDLPYGVAEREEWLRAGHGPSHLAQNCSGKHAALLATCARNGWPLETYLHPEHPLPTLIREVVAELTGEELTDISTDGCGTEVFALSLTGMARAFSKLVTAASGTPERRVADAMRAHPDMVAGPGRDVTALMAAVPGLLAKDGFEGIQLIALADGAAVALKISDGGDRARMPSAVPALIALGLDPAPLAPFNNLPVFGGGHPVGTLHGLPY
ncbi:L-asparaginase II [Arthrobacter silviterrae]|uniref:Asparaginase n=1 Tax=Arthrobacter silviterrae TaxID=2026658 RepID=A0ABX0DIJ7_9MICC|nr:MULTISPECIES: asparaginase [Arthrobacter]MCU6482002.1 asparaginase [Arthrobacter sp. A2-55]MDQ0279038.1 L-asparaginase II [Arthrobacter silviterrae]NGN84455.1 asparaginase [Arthrobacter silviterrae]